MTVAELLTDNESLLRSMCEAGIKATDVSLLPAYRRYLEIMATEGGKVTYAVYKVSVECGIPERTVWRIVQKFGKPIKAKEL